MATADVCKAMRTKLLSYAAVTALAGQRMYPDVLVQGTRLPAVIYRKLSTRREHTVGDCTRTAHSRIELECYATTREEANDVAHAIRNSGICAFQGTVASIALQGIQIDSGESYEDDPPTNGNQEHRYITSFDFMVSYTEAA